MSILLFQFIGQSPTPFAPPASGILADPTAGLIVAFGALVAALVGFFSIMRWILHAHFRETRAFNRVVLQILVPKERKSEGAGDRAAAEDRLEQIREEIGIAETFFASIAGLRAERGLVSWLRGRTDHFAFEMVMGNGLISYYIDVPTAGRGMIEQQIHAQYPYAHIEEMTDYNIFAPGSAISGAYLADRGEHVLPFKTYKTSDSDPLSSLLNVLAKAQGEGEAAAVQYIARSARKRWRRRGVFIVRHMRDGEKFENLIGKSDFVILLRKLFKPGKKKKKPGEAPEPPKEYKLSPLEEDMARGIEQKLAKGGLDVTVRLLSVANAPARAREQLENLISAFGQYNLYRYGNTFRAVIPRAQKRIIQEFIYRAFHERRCIVVNTEEMSSLWHLPLHSTEAPYIKWLGARKAPPPANIPSEGILLGHVLYRGADIAVCMKESDRRRHVYVIGKSGSGKSVLLENMAIQDIRAGRGVGIVDPHGELVERVLEHIPKERADDVVLFNPSDLERPIGLNMLEARTPDQKDFAVQEMIAIFYKLFPAEMIGPMFEHNMRNVMLTLMADTENPGTVIDIPRMFTDDEYVKTYLARLKDPVVRSFWEKEMAKTTEFHKSEMLGYLISKVGRFVENEMMRNIMGQQVSGFNFREIMDQQKILLVNLSKGTTGEVNAKLLGLILVAKLQMAALGRADMPEDKRPDFYLYIDEFQNFITDSISTILSEARKYRLNLIIAHQYMGQLADEKGQSPIRDAVLGNVGTMCCFRIGPEDAEILAKEFAPVFGSYDLINIEQFTAYVKLLIDNTASKPFNMKTYPPARGNPELAAAIKELSRLKYGRDRAVVEADILERTRLGSAGTGASDRMIESSL